MVVPKIYVLRHPHAHWSGYIALRTAQVVAALDDVSAGSGVHFGISRAEAVLVGECSRILGSLRRQAREGDVDLEALARGSARLLRGQDTLGGVTGVRKLFQAGWAETAERRLAGVTAKTLNHQGGALRHYRPAEIVRLVRRIVVSNSAAADPDDATDVFGLATRLIGRLRAELPRGAPAMRRWRQRDRRGGPRANSHSITPVAVRPICEGFR